MRQRRASTAVVSVLVTLALWSPSSEGAGPWRGQVVDLETGQPIEGVVVVAVWEKVSPGAMHPERKFEDVDELTTDADGRFVIPARRVVTLNPFVNIEGPRLVMFKAGYGQWGFRGEYEWLKRYNVEEQDARIAKARKAFESIGAQFELPALKTLDARRERLTEDPGLVLVPRVRLPRYLDALNRERAVFGLQQFTPR